MLEEYSKVAKWEFSCVMETSGRINISSANEINLIAR